MEGYKNYKREFIQLSSQNIILIHLFNDYENGLQNSLEDIEMKETNEAALKYDIETYERSAKQFFDQLEGHYCDKFLECLIAEATKRLLESDERLDFKFNRAQKALDNAQTLIPNDNSTK